MGHPVHNVRKEDDRQLLALVVFPNTHDKQLLNNLITTKCKNFTPYLSNSRGRY